MSEIIWQDFFEQAYKDGFLIKDYYLVIKKGKLNNEDVSKPSKEWISSLSKHEIIACITYHFRMDHFNEGSMLNYSIAEGYLLNLVQGYI